MRPLTLRSACSQTDQLECAAALLGSSAGDRCATISAEHKFSLPCRYDAHYHPEADFAHKELQLVGLGLQGWAPMGRCVSKRLNVTMAACRRCCVGLAQLQLQLQLRLLLCSVCLQHPHLQEAAESLASLSRQGEGLNLP